MTSVEHLIRVYACARREMSEADRHRQAERREMSASSALISRRSAERVQTFDGARAWLDIGLNTAGASLRTMRGVRDVDQAAGAALGAAPERSSLQPLARAIAKAEGPINRALTLFSENLQGKADASRRDRSAARDAVKRAQSRATERGEETLRALLEALELGDE